MVFPSAPSYLDPPNWQQQNHPQGDEINPHELPLPLPPLPSMTAIRPGSMADRARLANIPQPETSLKCPRCDSSNTKFCYFNNYSLNQPRHFCKTCRRYWTRGGTLRNVPVGGGCRRNKRSKRASSKSPATGDNNPSAPAATSTSISTLTQDLELGHVSALVPPLPLPFMAGNMHDQHLGVYSNIAGANIGLNYSSLRAVGGGGAVEQWRTVAPQINQQYPFMSGLESSVGQMISVKMEGNQGLHSRSNLSSNVVGQDQYSWGGNVWNDFSGFTTSSSTDQML